MCRWSYLPARDLDARSHHTIKASALNRIVLMRRVRHSRPHWCGKRRGSDRSWPISESRACVGGRRFALIEAAARGSGARPKI